MGQRAWKILAGETWNEQACNACGGLEWKRSFDLIVLCFVTLEGQSNLARRGAVIYLFYHLRRVLIFLMMCKVASLFRVFFPYPLFLLLSRAVEIPVDLN